MINISQLLKNPEGKTLEFIGNDKTEFLDRLDIEGSVLDAIEEVPKFIRRNNKLAAKIETMHRQSQKI